MNVLITGANGFVGKSICTQMLFQGHSVRAAIRPNALPIKNVEVELVETINASTDWLNALTEIDVVIHLAARVHTMSAEAYRFFLTKNVRYIIRKIQHVK